MKSWQTYSDLTFVAGHAPQESGPSEHKEHFWVTSQRHWPSFQNAHDGNDPVEAKKKITDDKLDLQGDPRTDAAIGWQHPCETLTDNSAPLSDICAAAQLWSLARWSATPVPANPSWEGKAWKGHNGAESRPDHILL